MPQFASFKQFYPYYLSEHRHPVCRALHYLGSSLVIAVVLFALISQQWLWLWALPVIGYGFAWLGHFIFEHNKPATFQYPFYSLAADWVMLKDFITGQLKHKMPPC
ncbi:membrane protein [Arsukibacterium sp. MJ3]|uniref:DUF962 domain-containing protein n=1 Tax=Arsukibacterium sp. MJ3 TaxID=1632859 RepID=UPI00062730D7|nr:DUF962 domain-containing protein [Arsukibacterium sp. MJ3]KKO50123.1 membrane protein [Arsukibacterium sp. MJ3]